MPRNPARGRVGCCGGRGGLKVKAEAGALSGVADSSLRLPVYRCKGAGDSAGQCTGKRRNGPCSDDTPSACLRPQISPTRPTGSLTLLLHRCWIIVIRRDLTAAAFPRKPICIPLLPRPRVLKVSVSAQRTTPYCVSSVYHLIRLSFTAPPPASTESRLVCPKTESSRPSTLSVRASPLNF